MHSSQKRQAHEIDSNMSQTFSEENHERTEELKIAVNQMTEVVDKLQKDFKKMKQTADQQYLAIEEGRNESENLREKITALEKDVTELWIVHRERKFQNRDFRLNQD